MKKGTKEYSNIGTKDHRNSKTMKNYSKGTKEYWDTGNKLRNSGIME